MTDANSEMAKRERQEKRYLEFLNNLKNYLTESSKDKGEENYERLWESAKNTNIRTAFSRFGENYGLDYSHMPEKYKEFFDENIQRLLNKDERTWGRLLESTIDIFGSGEDYKQLKELSPYKDQILVKIDYGSGYARSPQIEGDIQEFFDKIIENQGNYKIYDTDNYFLSMDSKQLGKSLEKIVWLSSGTSAAKHRPRDKDGNIKEE